MKNLLILTLLIFFVGCLNKKHLLDDKYKDGLKFSVKYSDEYDYDNLDLFNPKLDYSVIKDTLKIEISYIESGGPSFDGGYEIKDDTLTLILQDKYPYIGYTSEEFLRVYFAINLNKRSFKNIRLLRRYGGRINNHNF